MVAVQTSYAAQTAPLACIRASASRRWQLRGAAGRLLRRRAAAVQAGGCQDSRRAVASAAGSSYASGMMQRAQASSAFPSLASQQLPGGFLPVTQPQPLQQASIVLCQSCVLLLEAGFVSLSKLFAYCCWPTVTPMLNIEVVNLLIRQPNPLALW